MKKLCPAFVLPRQINNTDRFCVVGAAILLTGTGSEWFVDGQLSRVPSILGLDQVNYDSYLLNLGSEVMLINLTCQWCVSRSILWSILLNSWLDWESLLCRSYLQAFVHSASVIFFGKKLSSLSFSFSLTQWLNDHRQQSEDCVRVQDNIVFVKSRSHWRLQLTSVPPRSEKQ